MDKNLRKFLFLNRNNFFFAVSTESEAKYSY